MPEPMPVTTSIQVRWRDLDALGHVNNAVYLSYLELARLAYVAAALPGADIDAATQLPRDFQFILAEVQIKYRSPALLTDRPQVAIWVSRLGRKSFVFEYRLTDTVSGRVLAEACSTQVWYDYATGASKPVPEDAIARMEALQAAPIARAY